MSYRDLKSYQQTTIIYDYTLEFCHAYISPTSRTKDQMEQAARSGKQNIVEGSTQKTSEKNELFLLGVARASMQELLEDYEDFLRQRGLKQWDKDDPRAREIREMSYKSYMSDPETAANVAICLIHQANFLLDRQIQALEKQFIERGGYAEKLRHQREEEKKRQVVQNFWRRNQ